MHENKSLSPVLTAVLAFLAMTGPLATDMYLALFTAMQHELQTTASSVQLTLTTFLLGLGLGQLFLGPLSDRFGRRPVLLISLSIFVTASLLTAFTPNITVLIVLRLIQGLAGSASVVLARAIAADLTSGAETVRALSLIAMLMGLGPIIAPPLGAAVGMFFGWRGILATTGIFGIGMLLSAIFLLPESLPRSARHTGGIKTTLSNFKDLLKTPKFVFLLAAYALSFASMMAYISASPFVGQKVLGMTPLQYAFAFATGASALIVANMINAKFAYSRQPTQMLIFGISLSLSSSLVLFALIITSTLTWWSFILLVFFLIGGVGFAMSNSSALALILADKARGSGAALLGASQFALGGAFSPLVGAWGETTALPMALIILTMLTIALTAALIYTKQRRV